MAKLVALLIVAIVATGLSMYTNWEYDNCIKAKNAGNKELKCEDIKKP